MRSAGSSTPADSRTVFISGTTPSPVELARIGAQLPERAFNLLFRTGKPFRVAKLTRVLGLFRRG